MIALVTGGSGGLGSAVCDRLASEGHTVAIGCFRRLAAAEALARDLAARGLSASALSFDVTDPEAVERSVERVAAEHGGLDALVNAAASNTDGLLANLSPVDLTRMQAVNVAGTANCIRATSRWLFASGRGRIVNFSSVLAHRGTAGASVYASTKGAIESLTRSLAVELGGKRVTVNAVAPGFIDAGLGREAVRRAGTLLRESVPLRRAGRAEEVAAVVSFLLTEAASYVTGAVIPVDGGLQAGFRMGPDIAAGGGQQGG